MEGKYKGYVIRYREHDEGFYADIGEDGYGNKSLAKVKKYIDNLDKKDFERIDIFADSWDDEFDEGVVTSEVGYSGKYADSIDVWVTFKSDKKRRKFDVRHVYIDNEKNRKLIDSIKECKKQTKKIKERENQLKTEIERYKPKTLKK